MNNIPSNWGSSANKLTDQVLVRFTTKEKWATAGVVAALGLGAISLLVGIYALHGISPSLLSHLHLPHNLPLSQIGIGLTAGGGGFVLIGLGGAAFLKWQEHKSKRIFQENKESVDRDFKKNEQYHLTTMTQIPPAYGTLGIQLSPPKDTRYIVVKVLKDGKKCYHIFKDKMQAEEATRFTISSFPISLFGKRVQRVPSVLDYLG